MTTDKLKECLELIGEVITIKIKDRDLHRLNDEVIDKIHTDVDEKECSISFE
ncbi:hypothetical protein [Proteiniphilum acetatigenes]|uniref:hypothetical protein n=1 Tax=Proteiniphilum acetatigenes TaxID=294710 RepID=UPI00035C5FFE|nr:hypothetical protein [Proteiniphilum acetatigenes]